MGIGVMQDDLLWCIRFLIDDQSLMLRSLDDLLVYGYTMNKMKLTTKYLDLPAILMTKSHEYVILQNTNKKFIEVIYPDMQCAKFSWSEVYQLFKLDGMKLQYHHYLLEAPITKQMRTTLLKAFGEHKLFSLCFISLIFFYEIFSLIEPLFLNFALEHLDVFSSMMDVFLLLAVGFFMMGLSLAFGFYRQQMGLKCFGFFSKHFSQSLFTRLLMLPLRLMNTMHSNELFSRVNNVEQMFYRLLQQFFYLATDLLFFLLHLGMMFILSPKIACLDTLFLILMFFFKMKTLQEYNQHSTAVYSQQQVYTGFLLESFQGLSSLKLFKKEFIFLNRWQAIYQKYWHTFLKHDWMQYQLDFGLEFWRKSNLLISLGVACSLLMQAHLSIGAFVAILAIKTRVFARFESLCKRFMQWQYIKTPLNRLSDLLKDKIPPKMNMPFFYKEEVGNLEARQMKALESSKVIDQCFEASKKYFLQGGSGVGKSSFLRAMLGMKSPYAGEVYYHKLSCLDDDWRLMREHCKMVLQQDMLWQGTVLDNITFFTEEIDDAHLQFILGCVGLEKSFLNHSVKHLSAGEKQRVWIARALYQKPKWLILDEACCHLDKSSENQLINNLLKLPLGLIMVSHTLDYQAQFDEVIIFDSAD